MMNPFKCIHLATVLIMLGAVAISNIAYAEVIYREIFPNNTTDNIYHPNCRDDTDWIVHKDNGVEATGSHWFLASNAGDTSATGNTPVNSKPAYAANGDRSYLYIGWGGTDGIDYLMWTDEYTVERDIWEVTEIRWFQRNASTSDVIRPALEIGDSWYASDTGYTQTVVDTAEFKTLNFGTAAWRSLNFTPDSALSLGSGTALPSTGDITAFGWYNDSFSGTTLRLDSFEISAVPEPATLVLLVSAALSVLLWRLLRRRR